jgi:hypothetical protein
MGELHKKISLIGATVLGAVVLSASFVQKGQVLQRDCGERLSRLFLCEHASVREAQQTR